MTQFRKAFGVLLVMMFGLWGCARGPANEGSSASTNDKIKALEVKTAKLENDLKAVLAAKDQLRKQLGEAEEAQAQMQREIERLQPVVRERDELLLQVKSRITERDQLQAQYDGFRRNIKELLGQAEASLPDNKKDMKMGLVSRPTTGQPCAAEKALVGVGN
jgi:chromosome segregation ATPase